MRVAQFSKLIDASAQLALLDLPYLNQQYGFTECLPLIAATQSSRIS